MIQSPEDLAEELRFALAQATAGEAAASQVSKSAFIFPPQWTFGVETVEGKRFTVTIAEADDAQASVV